MTDWPLVGVGGARGVVGGGFLDLFRSAGLPADRLRCFGQEPGSVAYDAVDLPVEVVSADALAGLDVLFLATDAAVSRELIPGAAADVPLIIDNSSAFRLDRATPLVVPEANASDVTARAVYADLARLAAGERPVLFR